MDHEFNAYLDQEIARINKELEMRPRLQKPIPTDTRPSVASMVVGVVLFLLALGLVHAFLFYTPWGHAILNRMPL